MTAYILSTDSTQEMYNKLGRLSQHLHDLKIIAGVSKTENKKTKRVNEEFPLYSGQDQLVLAAKIKDLIAALQKDGSKSDLDVRRVLHATAHAVLEPTARNCNQLYRVAQEVEGHSEHWKTAIDVLVTIVMLLLSPLILLMMCIYCLAGPDHKAKTGAPDHNAKKWAVFDHGPKGLSKLTHGIRRDVQRRDGTRSLQNYNESSSFFGHPPAKLKQDIFDKLNEEQLPTYEGEVGSLATPKA